MATDVERLLIRLEANATKFEREMDRARGVSAKATREIESNFEKLNAGVARAIAPLAGTIVAALSLNEIQKAADTYTRALNQLRVAGVSAADMPNVFNQLFESAQRNAVPIEALAQLYGRVSQAQTTLKATSGELLGLTEIVAQSLRVSGASAESASGALLQLAQALSGGKVQAEEYNSLLDGMYPLLQAAAAGIKEAGGDVAKLTRLVKDGEVSSEAFFRGIQAGAPVLSEKLGGAALTVAQATTRMNNEFVRAVGEYDRLTGASGGLAAALGSIASSLAGIATTAAHATNKIIELMGAAGNAVSGQFIQDKVRRGFELTGAEADYAQREYAGRFAFDSKLGLAIQRAQARRVGDFRRSEVEFQNTPPQWKMSDVPYGPPAPVNTSKINAISLKNYRVNGDDAGGGKSSRERLNEYEREIQALQKKIELLDAETGALGKSTAEVAKAKAAAELLNAAKKAGMEDTPALRAAIDQEVDGLFRATEAYEKKKQAMEGMKELQQFIGQSISSFFSDVVSGGKNASDALMNLTKRLADAALQAALLGQGPLASLFGSKESGGFLGSIFSGLKGAFGYSSGGYTGAGGKYQPAGIVHAGEYVFSQEAVKRLGLGNLEALHRGYASGGFVGPSVPALMPSRREGGVTIRINNTSKAQVSDPQESSKGGEKTIDIMIDEVVAGKINTPGSRTRTALGSNFGLSSALRGT